MAHYNVNMHTVPEQAGVVIIMHVLSIRVWSLYDACAMKQASFYLAVSISQCTYNYQAMK